MFSFVFPACGGIQCPPNTMIISTEIFLLIYLLVGWAFYFSGKAHRYCIPWLLKCFSLPFWLFHYCRKYLYFVFEYIFCAICCICHAMYTDFLGLDHLFLLRVSHSLYLVKLLIYFLYMHLIISWLFVCLWLDVYNLFLVCKWCLNSLFLWLWSFSFYFIWLFILALSSYIIEFMFLLSSIIAWCICREWSSFHWVCLFF